MLALGLAVAVGGYGYNYLLSSKRGALTSETKAQPNFILERPGQPARLTPHGEGRAFAAPAAAHLSPAGSVKCEVILASLAVDLVGENAGIASYSKQTGGSFHWVPLSEGVPRLNGSIALSIRITSKDAVLTLSTSEKHARHGYLVSRTVQPGELSPRSIETSRTFAFRSAKPPFFVIALRPIVFDAVAANTTLELPEGVSHAGPLQLVRVGDLDWHPQVIAASGLFLDSERATILLGAGVYDLVDPIDATVRQRFRVPTAEAITIESRLARPRGRLQ